MNFFKVLLSFLFLLTPNVSAHPETPGFDSMVIADNTLSQLDSELRYKLTKLFQRINLLEEQRTTSYAPRLYTNGGGTNVLAFDSNVLVDVMIQTLEIKAQIYSKWAHCQACHEGDLEQQKLLIFASKDFSKKVDIIKKSGSKKKSLLQKLGIYFHGEYLYMKSEKGENIARFFIASYGIWTLLTEAAEWAILLHLAPICNISQVLYFMAFRTMLEMSDAAVSWWKYRSQVGKLKLGLIWKWALAEIRLIYVLRKATWEDEVLTLREFKKQYKISFTNKFSYFYRRKMNEIDDWLFEKIPLLRNIPTTPYDLLGEKSIELNSVMKELMAAGLWADIYHNLEKQTPEIIQGKADLEQSLKESIEKPDIIYAFRSIQETTAVLNIFRSYLKEFIRIQLLSDQISKEQFMSLVDRLGSVIREMSEKRKQIKLEILDGKINSESMSKIYSQYFYETKRRMQNIFEDVQIGFSCQKLFH